MFRGLDQIASSQQIDDKIQQIVAQADRDNSGTVDQDEFVAWYESVYLAELGGEARRIFTKLDKDGSGSLDREELKSFVQEVVSDLPSLSHMPCVSWYLRACFCTVTELS
jgi:hypothetical protein